MMGDFISQLRNASEYFCLALVFQADKLGITYTDDPSQDRSLISFLSESGVKTGVSNKKQKGDQK
jgi:hypothetical protein